MLNDAVGLECGPAGLTVRCAPPDAPGMWHDIAEMPDGRLAVTLGRSRDPARATRLAADIASALRTTCDPRAALRAAADQDAAGVDVLCAVIDRPSARLICSSIGDIPIVVTAPDGVYTALDPVAGELADIRLAPAATVLFCIPEPAAGILEQVATLHPDQAADRIIDGLPGGPEPALAVLYRQTPAPLKLTVPADPESLATVRGHLRHWLAMTGVGSENAADALLAVGEAASNATEHSVVGVNHDVELTVRADAVGDRLLLSVSDNGRWKPPPESPGHRGHGIRLINALVDGADLRTDEQGTTVEMIKGWRR